MYILLCADEDAAAVADYAERIRNRFSYRGMACIVYNFQEPAEAMHDGAIIALQQYSGVIELPIKDVFSEEKDFSLLNFSRAWLERRLPLQKIAHARINSITARWQELGMLYVVVVYGNMTKKDLEEFPRSYKVLLDCGKQESRSNTGSLNDCAVSNIFDQVVDTSKAPPDEAANLICAKFTDKITSKLETTDAREQTIPNA